MIARILIRIARKVIESVLSQLMQQFNVVEQMAQAPMQAMVQQVVGGVWIGKGADAFVEEVSSLMIPGTQNINQHISVFSNNLTRALDTMTQADQQVRNIVGGLNDIFGGIY
jgi:uncharacterized protein YukE